MDCKDSLVLWRAQCLGDSRPIGYYSCHRYYVSLADITMILYEYNIILQSHSTVCSLYYTLAG